MKVKFGIIGTGSIANAFAMDAKLTDQCELVAVASRNKETADDFARKHHISKSYGSYQDLYDDEDIDAVYIGIPHVFHKEETIKALRGKKAVLCEKPFAMNSNDASEMIEVAREENVLLMEGMWTRFFPAYKKMKSLLANIGEIKFIKADFGFDAGSDYPKDGRLLNPDLGGGALFDVGIYPISAVRDVMHVDPINIYCTQMMNDQGIDLISTYNYMFKNGALACLYSAINVNTQTELFISGTNGTLKLPRFFCPEELTYTDNEGYAETYHFPIKGQGYTYEIEAFCKAYEIGQLESAIMPLSETLAIMNIIDQIEVKIGYLKY